MIAIALYLHRSRWILAAVAIAWAPWAIADTTAPPVSAAQSEPLPADVLADVVVTAERQAARIQDVPAAVTAIGSDELERRDVHLLADVLTGTPSVQINTPFGENGPIDFVIRGISSTDDEQNQSKPIAVYIDDGVKQITLFEIMPMFDVDRVEVLRGPQGTLYGKNATGGAINIITKAPGFDEDGYITLGYGNFDTVHLDGAIQTPLIDQILSSRFAFTFTRDDGVITQLTPGLGNPDQTDILALRESIYYRPSSSFDATLKFTYLQSGGREDTPLATYPGVPNFEQAWPNLWAIPGVSRQGVGFYDSATNMTPDRDIQTEGININAHWYITPQYTLTSVTTFDNGHWYEAEDDDGLPINWGDTSNDVPYADQIVQELRLGSKLDGPIDWQAGLFGSHDRLGIRTNYLFEAAPQCGQSCNFGLGGIGYAELNSFEQKRDSYSGYIRGEYRITPTVTFTAGIRESYDTLDVLNYSAALGSRPDPSFDPTFTDIDKHATFSNTSSEGVVNWKVTPDAEVYASYKQGYRTGGVNASAENTVAEISIAPPETTVGYEAGIKTEWFDHRIISNAAIFHMDYKGQQVQQSVLVGTETLFPLISIPRAKVDGIEAEATLRPLPSTTLRANVSVINPQYTQGPPRLINSYGLPVNITGNQMIGAAKFHCAINGDIRVYGGDSKSLYLNVNAVYSSRVFFDIENTPLIQQNGYWVANSRLSYETQATTLAIYGKNLFNEEYLTSRFIQPGDNYSLRGTPRQFGIEATRRF